VTFKERLPMFAFYSNRPGCIGSIAVSTLLSLLLLAVMFVPSPIQVR
jgi:hypothetical protein